MNKKALIALMLIIIVAIGGGLYYKQYLDENEAPPSIQATGTYQGLTSAKPTGFLKAGKSQLGKAFESTKGDGEEKASLKVEKDSGGLSDVYSEDDTDFSEVMENFKASKSGQEYMIGFYDNNDAEWKTTKQKYYGTKGISVISDEDNLSDTEIPANNAFVFVSNENSELYGYKDTSEEPSESYNFCRDGKEGWTAGVVVEDELYDSLADCLDSVTSVWVKVRNAPLNDKFKKIYTEGKSDSALKKYKMKKFYMAWVKFSEDPVVADEEKTKIPPATDKTIRPELKDLKVISDSKDLGTGKVVLDDKGMPTKALEFSWNSSFDEDSVAQYKKDTRTDPVASYTWKLKDASAKVIWELTQEYGTRSGDGVSNTQDDTACFKQLYDKAGKELASGKDWICKYVSIPADLKLTADTAYSFELTAFDGKATAIKKIDFATEKTGGATTGKTAEELAAEAKVAAEEALKALQAKKIALEADLKNSTLATEKVLLEEQIKELEAKKAELDANLKKLTEAADKAKADQVVIDAAVKKLGEDTVALIAIFKTATDSAVTKLATDTKDLKAGDGAALTLAKNTADEAFTAAKKAADAALKAAKATADAALTAKGIALDPALTAAKAAADATLTAAKAAADATLTAAKTAADTALTAAKVAANAVLAQSIAITAGENNIVYPSFNKAIIGTYSINATKAVTIKSINVTVTNGADALEENPTFSFYQGGTQITVDGYKLTVSTDAKPLTPLQISSNIKAEAQVGTIINTLWEITMTDGSIYKTTTGTKATVNPRTFTAKQSTDGENIEFVTDVINTSCRKTISATPVKLPATNTNIDPVKLPATNTISVSALIDSKYGEYTLTLDVSCPSPLGAITEKPTINLTIVAPAGATNIFNVLDIILDLFR